MSSTPPLARHRSAEGRPGAARPSEVAPAVRRDSISPLTVNRISVYLRCLKTLEARGVSRISSHELAREFHLSSSGIRKDLAQFGEFGVRGVGYDVSALAGKLATLLRLDAEHRVVVVGMGNLGTALARFPAFNSGSFQVVAAIDSDPAKSGRRVGRLTIATMSELDDQVRATGATTAILAVPADAAQAAYDACVASGISAVLNFAPVSLRSRRGCRVKNVDLRIHLEELAFYLGD
ncbi:MAG: redox-sensing transcriptional repressor Rex [Myxococcota bacterium]